MEKGISYGKDGLGDKGDFDDKDDFGDKGDFDDKGDLVVEASRYENVPEEHDFDIDPRMPLSIWKKRPAEDTLTIEVDPNNPEKVLKIGSRLNHELWERLCNFLKANLDVCLESC